MKKVKATTIYKVQNYPQLDSEYHNPSVSASSKFLDATWDFSSEITNPTYSNGAKVIRWNFEIREGECFDDPKYVSLMLACKQLLYATIWHPERSGKFKANTVTHTWQFLRHFVIFLVNRKRPILRFKDVTKSVVNEYQELLALPNNKGKKRGKGDLYCYYKVIKLLYLYRHKISDSIQVDMFDGESPSKMLGLSYGQQAKTEFIPDNILSRLIISALDYVNHYSDYLIEAAASVERIRQENHDKHRSTVFYHSKRELKKLRFNLQVSSDASFNADVFNVSTLAEHLILLRTACFILIALVTGMRISELLSLEAECVEKENTDEGDFIWIHSSLHKTLGSTEAIQTKWLCGPVAAKAVSVLERLTFDFRHTTSHRRLFVPVSKWGAHTWNGKAVGANDMTERLKDYVIWLDLRDEKGKLFRLSTHMFRRTFARHVVRCDTTNLLALKDHFKHMSLAMTDYYIGVDEELQDLLNDEANRLSFETFDKALRSDRLGGPRGKAIVKQIDTAIADGRLPSEFRGEAGAHLRKEMVIEWVAAGQQVYPCSSGNSCWFREGFALCTNGDRPIVEVCNPLGCPNSFVLPEHGPYWRSIEERAEELLQLDPSGEPYRQRLYQIIRIAKKVRQDIT